MIKLRPLLVNCLFLVSGTLFAQTENVPSRISVVLRGKYGIFGIENARWSCYSYGAEIHFGKHHSFGADGGVTRSAWDNDGGDDSAILFSEIRRRTFAYIDYKYLISFHRQFIYAQGYMKPNGRFFSYNKTNDADYSADHPELFLEYGRGKFTEFGVGAGTMLYFKKTEGRMGVDINLNLAFRYGSKLTSYYSEDQGWHYTPDSDDVIFPYLRFTLFYHFFRYQQ